jgi:hypothetical protein
LEVFWVVGASKAHGHHVIGMVFTLASFNKNGLTLGASTALALEEPRDISSGVPTARAANTSPPITDKCQADVGMRGIPFGGSLNHLFRMLRIPTARAFPRRFSMPCGILSASLAVLFGVSLTAPRITNPFAFFPSRGSTPDRAAQPFFFNIRGIALPPILKDLFAIFPVILAAVLRPPRAVLLPKNFAVSRAPFPVNLVLALSLRCGERAAALAPSCGFLFGCKLTCSHSVCPFRSLVRAASMLKHRFGPLLKFTANTLKSPANMGVLA